MSLLRNFYKTPFVVGDRFVCKGLQFKILDPYSAICLSSIGLAPYIDTEEETIPKTAIVYKRSSIRYIVEDWFDINFKDVSVDYNKSRVPAEDELYVIQKVTSVVYGTEDSIIVPGRYVIYDRLGNVINSCGKWGFKNENSARNSLRHYTNTAPIPQEHIDAYNKATKT